MQISNTRWSRAKEWRSDPSKRRLHALTIYAAGFENFGGKLPSVLKRTVPCSAPAWVSSKTRGVVTDPSLLSAIPTAALRNPIFFKEGIIY